ncbi:unnamed protein product [Adineta steineri]|uniref:Uncharacterized protein n=1 Tax=Adineta steineri TaxID=433720 RepID=A0A813UCH9_9BILA|nr:unnamed protein product [Adineta steineri]CAF0824428.1 unnamed protein product [Adineta steineri]
MKRPYYDRLEEWPHSGDFRSVDGIFSSSWAIFPSPGSLMAPDFEFHEGQKWAVKMDGGVFEVNYELVKIDDEQHLAFIEGRNCVCLNGMAGDKRWNASWIVDTRTGVIQRLDIEDLTQAIIERFYINDPNKNLLDQPDFYSDAQQLIDKYISKHPSHTQNTAYQVDHLSGMSVTGEVLIGTDKNEPYDVRLTKTNVNYGIVGLYNFYRTQIIKHKSKNNLYFLFTRWGRIGDAEGQYQLTPYSTLDECRKEFLKVFREKTDFLKTLINRQAIRLNIDKTQLDIEWMPVSQLKRETLQKARDLLIELKNNIEKKQELTLAIQRGKTIEQQKQFKTILDSIYKYINEYYTIIPLRGYADEKLPIIDNEGQLKQQEKII